MPILPTEGIQPGMITETDVCDRGGRMLLGRGTVITDRHLRIFKAWGVTEIQVHVGQPGKEKPPQETSASIPKAQLDMAREKTEKLFFLANVDHPVMQRLFDITVERIARKGE